MIMERVKVGNEKLEEIDMLQEVNKHIEAHIIWVVEALIMHFFRPEMKTRIMECADRELLQASD